jgi:hypothetical protein
MDLVQLNDPGREETPPRLREDLRQRRARAAAATEFGAALTTLGIKQRSAAQWFCTSERNIRRWKSGTRKTPPGVMVTVRLMLAGKVGPADVELAAASISGRANGHAKPKPPAPRLVGPAPAPTALARVEPAPADPGRTIGEKILALAPGSCRWPLNDPRHPDFCFCGREVVEPPYCKEHRRAAYLGPHVDASKRFAHLDFEPAGSRRDLLRAIGHGGHLIESGTEPIAR